jgi:hypothetical protein
MQENIKKVCSLVLSLSFNSIIQYRAQDHRPQQQQNKETFAPCVTISRARSSLDPWDQARSLLPLGLDPSDQGNSGFRNEIELEFELPSTILRTPNMTPVRVHCSVTCTSSFL